MLCSGSRDYSVRFWDTATAKEIRASADNLNVVTAVKWIPGETIVVQSEFNCRSLSSASSFLLRPSTASEDLTLRLWDSRTQSVVQRFSTDRYFPVRWAHCSNLFTDWCSFVAAWMRYFSRWSDHRHVSERIRLGWLRNQGRHRGLLASSS